VTGSIGTLLSARAVRERSALLFELCRDRRLEHFAFDERKLAPAADYVIATMRADYPDLAIPYHSRWRHFEVGGVDRWAQLAARLPADPDERARAAFELAITSVLLDAGAGPGWRYLEKTTGRQWSRSEGLAVASFEWIASGAFSSDPTAPWRVEAAKLAAVTATDLAAAFQVSTENPLVGVEGRVALLRRLGAEIGAKPTYFGGDRLLRLGGFYDHLRDAAGSRTGSIGADAILVSVLAALGGIWPGRFEKDGVNLGDTWRHQALAGDALDGLVPFHKLSQWLTYSLLEPLEAAGIAVAGLDGLTGLPEYRNGGLFVDLGVLIPRHGGVMRETHKVGSAIVVEWRALTVTLLDRLAEEIRRKLGVSAAALPLAKILQGGTWSAGRRIAAEKRPGGAPPIGVDSDGTVF
jgi:hypothetical protein